MSLCYQMWKSFPMFQDAFGIQYELLYFMKRFGVLMIFIIISQILSWKVDVRFIVISNFCYVLALVVLAWSVIGIPSYYNEIFLKKKKPLDLVVPMDSSGCNIECELWEDIILNIHGFNAFMEFLQTEFMTQYLLFVTEYAQLIKVMSNQQVFIDLCDNTSLHFRLFVSNQLPLSTIIDQFDKESAAASNQKQIIIDCFVQTVNKLYLKYIISTAPLVLELDIDDELKKRFHAWFITPKNVQSEKDMDHRCIDILECFQYLLSHNELILNDSYNQFRRSDIAHALVTFFSRNPRSKKK
eukprot:251448_1